MQHNFSFRLLIKCVILKKIKIMNCLPWDTTNMPLSLDCSNAPSSCWHRPQTNNKGNTIFATKASFVKRDIKPPQWVNMVQSSWDEGVSKLSTTHAKQKVLETLPVWLLFSSSFFAVSKKILILSKISITSLYSTNTSQSNKCFPCQ